MILHLVTDEKFTDYAIKQFSYAGANSEFILIPSNFGSGDDYSKLISKCKIIFQNSKAFQNLLCTLDNYSAVILHGMHWGKWETQILSSVPKQVKIAWVLWGGDVYGRSDVKDNFLAPITNAVCKFRDAIKFLDRNKHIKDNSWEIPLAQFNRVDYCMTSQDEEFDYAKKFTGSSFKRLWYTYYSIEEIIGSLYNSKCQGNNIWLGNSATASNNHFDALLKLHKYKKQIKDRKLVIPLSYPGIWVKNAIYKFAKCLFGQNIKPLFEFCAREEYNKLMLDCNVMIMPHYMSQGMGNIYTGLWLGMRVYMSKKNISYNFLKRLGVLVFSLEDELALYGLQPLSEEDFLRNREILSQYYGKEHVMQEVKNVVKVLS